MAGDERTVLDYYQLSTPYPVEWPADKDASDGSEDEEAPKTLSNGLDRRKSRYQALERVSSSRRSLVPGTQMTGDGVENLVQRDEPDPLGSSESVVRILRQMGLGVQDDAELRNRFLLSSTTFSPALFLSQVHSNATTDDLLQGLDSLSRSIDQKSASLKVLVESNFERFVRAKATIDNVYLEMKSRGADRTPADERPQSLHTSRNSVRASSGNQASMLSPIFPTESGKKNALLKESEYGVLGIKTPLLEVSAKAEEVWGPALGGREKEDSIKAMATTVEKYKEFYEVSGAITDCIKRKDYESLLEEYGKARRFADDSKRVVESLTSAPPTEAQLYQVLLAARVWHNVEVQIENFKRDVWRRLTAVQWSLPKTNGVVSTSPDQNMELIGILLELGVTDNPIWVWLLSRYDYLKSKIQATSERSRVETEILRRKLANGEKPTAQVFSSHLRSLARQSTEEKPPALDCPEIIELWERMVEYLNIMLSSEGLLGEVLEFWRTAQSFIEGKAQKTLPTGYNGASRHHHRLSEQGTIDLQKGTVEIIDMIRDSVSGFFLDLPIEDISTIFSPLPITPKTPKSSTSLTPTALRGYNNLDPNNLPPPSPNRGEAWEKFAFWPPWSNSISGVHYLAKLLVLVGIGASEMAAVAPVGKGDGQVLERLKTLVGGARDRCVTAICAAWNKDAENIKVLEDWKRSNEKKHLTRMPSNFNAFESAMLTGMQKILYISEAMDMPGSPDVVLPPSPKLLQMVRSQFVTTLYKTLSGMVENAERPVKRLVDDWTTDGDELASPISGMVATSIGANTVNASDRHVRMLLTLSNLQALRVEIVPNLTGQFENAFSVKLTEESKTIRDVLTQIDTRLFQTYTRPSVEHLRSLIRKGISAPDWAPETNTKPKQVRPYVYGALLSLVLVHSQVSTTASNLTLQMISYLLEQISKDLLETFKQRQKYSLAALMQATLDVEFVAQTLSQFTTDRASELQSQIYQELDRGTDHDARTKLQSELPEMRAVLKKLREGSKSEFACFKKPRTKLERQQTQ